MQNVGSQSLSCKNGIKPDENVFEISGIFDLTEWSTLIK